MRRLVAVSLDEGLALVIVFLFVIVRDRLYTGSVTGLALVVEAALVTALAVQLPAVAFWRWGGQTPAMRLLHLRVVPEIGTGPLTLSRCLIRYVAGVASAIALVGWWSFLAGRSSTTAFDRASKTRVVDIRQAAARVRSL